MIVADSIGFSATHTITAILSEVPGADVSHGSRNFDLKRPMGQGDVTPVEFARQMAVSAEAGNRCFAVHTNFDPQEFKHACGQVGITYKVITRDPARHFRSCYSWLMKKLLDGDRGAYAQVVQMNQQLHPVLGGYSNLHTGVYGFAMWHVSQWMMSALASGAELVKMEDLVSDESKFRACFDLPAEARLAHFEGEEKHQASHVGKLEIPQIKPEEIEALHKAMQFNMGSRSLDYTAYRAALGY
jgi:hypothetical protein